jgi:hypothetical protein
MCYIHHLQGEPLIVQNPTVYCVCYIDCAVDYNTYTFVDLHCFEVCHPSCVVDTKLRRCIAVKTQLIDMVQMTYIFY